jgi:hypothetical protein
MEIKDESLADYIDKLDKSSHRLDEGRTISFSMEELEAMESDDWEPSQKVKEFMERMNK